MSHKITVAVENNHFSSFFACGILSGDRTFSMHRLLGAFEDRRDFTKIELLLYSVSAKQVKEVAIFLHVRPYNYREHKKCDIVWRYRIVGWIARKRKSNLRLHNFFWVMYNCTWTPS